MKPHPSLKYLHGTNCRISSYKINNYISCLQNWERKREVHEWIKYTRGLQGLRGDKSEEHLFQNKLTFLHVGQLRVDLS